MIKNFLKARFSKRYRASEHPRDIYAPHGSFVVFLRDYFQKGGDLKHDAFMFGETITIAEKARKLGIRVVYDPRLRVGHAVHSTTKLFRSRKMIRYQWEAAKYVYEKYYVNSSQGTQ